MPDLRPTQQDPQTRAPLALGAHALPAPVSCRTSAGGFIDLIKLTTNGSTGYNQLSSFFPRHGLILRVGREGRFRAGENDRSCSVSQACPAPAGAIVGSRKVSHDGAVVILCAVGVDRSRPRATARTPFAHQGCPAIVRAASAAKKLRYTFYSPSVHLSRSHRLVPIRTIR